MATLFTQIIQGEIPGRFVWADDICVAFLTIAPITPGHTLIVPRAEIEEWTEADEPTSNHLMWVAQAVGKAQKAAWKAPRIGLLAEGFLVPHLHFHVWPAQSEADFDVHRVDASPSAESLDGAADLIREQLRIAGHSAQVPGPGPLKN